MAITVNKTPTVEVHGNNLNGIPTAADSLLVMYTYSFSDSDITAVSIGGTALTELPSSMTFNTEASGSCAGMRIWYTLAPPSGGVLNITGRTSTSIVYTAYTGVDTTTPLQTPVVVNSLDSISNARVLTVTNDTPNGSDVTFYGWTHGDNTSLINVYGINGIASTSSDSNTVTSNGSVGSLSVVNPTGGRSQVSMRFGDFTSNDCRGLAVGITDGSPAGVASFTPYSTFS